MFKGTKIAIQCLWCKKWLQIELKNGKSELGQPTNTEDPKERENAEALPISTLAEMPMVLVNCSCCQQPHRLPDGAADNTILCLKCRAIIQIPDQAEKPTTFSGGAETEFTEDEE